jgi:hypothetical protein
MAARIPVKRYCVLLLEEKIMVVKMQQLMLRTGTAIWWVTRPDSSNLDNEICTDLEFWKKMVRLNQQNVLNTIKHRFLVTTKLLLGNPHC